MLAELKRPQARARAAELQRRLEHTYSKRHRHEVACGRVHEIGERLQEGEAAAAAAATAPYELDPDRSAALRPVFLGVSLHFSFPSDLAMNNEKLIS